MIQMIAQGDCTRDVASPGTAALLAERLWCAFDRWWYSDVEGVLDHFESVLDMIQLGRPLGRCLDQSPWPFTRKQLLLNIKGFYKISHSPFVETTPPKEFNWLDPYTVKKKGYGRGDETPYMFYSQRDYIHTPEYAARLNEANSRGHSVAFHSR